MEHNVAERSSRMTLSHRLPFSSTSIHHRSLLLLWLSLHLYVPLFVSSALIRSSLFPGCASSSTGVCCLL